MYFFPLTGAEYDTNFDAVLIEYSTSDFFLVENYVKKSFHV